MENEEIDSTSTHEMGQNVPDEKDEESQLCIEDKSNTAFQDEKDDLGSNSSEENSVVTLASASASSQTIKVYLRLKPLPSKIDLTREQEDAYTIVNSKTLLTKFPGLHVNTRSLKNLKASERVSRTFTFTTAFGSAISQTELFDKAMKNQIQDFLGGQTSTVMSYGTSNAGKSYTLYGVPSALGIIPLSINFIFREVRSTMSTPWFKPVYENRAIGLSSTDRARELEIRDKLISLASPEKTEFFDAYQTIQEKAGEEEADLRSRQDEHIIYSVWISFAEIYNDAIYDLLSSDCQKKRLPLKMVTDKQGRTFIKDLRTVYVNSDVEAYQILLAGQYKSRIAATTLNSRSSRSHCIFTLKLLKYYAESTPEDVEVTALSFCDLAGSGRLKMTTNMGDLLKETQNINTSLLVLGRCLKSIWEGQSLRRKSELVGPFRESKLTRLFQRALSGKEHITLIVNVNPVPSLYAETQNVLNFSAIAKKIIVEPVTELRKNIFMSRFSRVVSQSAKTLTDWDHAAVEDSAHEFYPVKVQTSNYVLRECYDDLSAEYEKLKKEYSALKTSMIDKDLEIREEMANTYTGLINDLEANWRSRSKDVEEQQEHLLAWSVNQVENFYKEKLNRLNSRKRRRWDDGDTVDDREADFREIEAENASLTAKILVTKETIKELRSARENAIADKNKAVFELSLVKEQIIGVKKMLEAAENDIQCEEDRTHLTEELKRQLSSREERIQNLKEFLDEAKEEYIRITSDAGQMHEELTEANVTLIENAERIEDLEEQLDQSNIFLAERAKEMEKLTEKLERQSKQLIEFEERAKSAEKELKESAFIKLNLMDAVEDLNMSQKIACTRASQHLNHAKHSSTNSEDNIDYETNSTKSKETEIISGVTNVESENSPAREEFRVRNLLENIRIRVTSLEELNGESKTTQDSDNIVDTDEQVYNENQDTSKLSELSEINDSGIAETIGSENQTMEQINSMVDKDFEVDETSSLTGHNSGDEQLLNLQLEYGELSARNAQDTFRVKKLFQELEDAHREMANVDYGFSSHEVRATRYKNNLESIETELRSVNVNKLKRELQFADIIAHLEMKIDEYEEKIETFQKGLTTRMDKERFYCKCLNDKVSRLEKQLSETHVQVETMAIKCSDEQDVQIGELKKEVFELKDNLKSQFTRAGVNNGTLEKDINTVSELQLRVKEFGIALAKFQTVEDNQHKQLLNNVERLSLLESQIQNWPIRELENARAISTLHDKLKHDSEIEEHFCSFNPDLHSAEDVENEGELSSKLCIESCQHGSKGFNEFHISERNTSNEKLENYISSFQNQGVKKTHMFNSNVAVASCSDEATAINLLIPPTSTSRRAAKPSNTELTPTTILDETSIASNSVVPVKDSSLMNEEKLLQQKTTEGIEAQSETPERFKHLNDPDRRSVTPPLKQPPTFLSDSEKFVTTQLTGSRWASKQTRAIIRKNGVEWRKRKSS